MIWHFLLPPQTVLRLLRAVLASTEPGWASEAHRGGGNGGKKCNLFLETQRKGKGEQSRPETSKQHLTHLSSSTFISKHHPCAELTPQRGNWLR